MKNLLVVASKQLQQSQAQTATMGLMFPIYLISVTLSSGLTLLSAYQLLELSDLDCEHIKPQRCCSNLNRVVIPELLCVATIAVLHLVTLNWLPLVTTVPMLSWLIYRYQVTPSHQISLFDPTSICDHEILNKHVRQCLFKIGFHVIHFLCFLYMMIISIITA